ncbi:MAG TPA: hemolysin family protein [Phototrophicaceae bacterium]|nr:hemolysin family protein [Phototrophicaceae bacterium]
MDQSGLTSLLVIIILIVLHGFIELAYAAIANVRRTPLKEAADKGSKKAYRTLELAENLPHLSVTRQVILILVRFAIVAVATVRIADPLIHTEDASGVFLIPELGYLVVLLPTALVTYLLGELVPQTFGEVYADTLAPRVSAPLRLLALLFSPLAAIFMSISRTLSRVAGKDGVKEVTEEEILTLLDVGQQGGTIENTEKKMIYSVLQFGETIVREVMVPRPDVTAVEIQEPLATAVKLFMESGHSRIPVYEDRIDNIKGMLYAKDLLKLLADGSMAQKTIRELMRPAYFVPESKRADILFNEMQVQKAHIAVIVDEYGGTAGVVTIEDLIEEIVGDIRDEYDVNEEAVYTRIGENEYVVDGAMNIDDLNTLLDSDLPNDDNDSIGGYVYGKLGHVPQVGDTVEAGRLLMRVDQVENLRIRKVHIVKRAPILETQEVAPAEPKAEPGGTPAPVEPAV